MESSRRTPPAARHMLADAASLHAQVSVRDKRTGGSAHIPDPRALADTFTTVAETVDFLPTVIGHLTDHLVAFRDAQRLELAENARLADTDMVCGHAFLSAREAIPALEHSARALRALADTLGHLAPNKPEPDPADEDYRPETGWTGHQRIAFLRKRLNWYMPVWADRGGLDADFRRLTFTTLATLLAEGRMSEAAHVVTRDVPQPAARTQMAAELVAVAELLITVALVQDASLKALGADTALAQEEG